MRGLIRRIQNRGYATLARIADHLDALTAGDESNAVLEALDAVNLMTVHASKGLEFPIVFVVNLARGASGLPRPVRVSTDDVSVGPFVSEMDEQERSREREETKRLLYVALTRARDRLYLSASLKDGALSLGRGCLAEVLPESMRSLFVRAAQELGLAVEWTSEQGRTHTLKVGRGTDELPSKAAVAVLETASDRFDVLRLPTPQRSEDPEQPLAHAAPPSESDSVDACYNVPYSVIVEGRVRRGVVSGLRRQTDGALDVVETSEEALAASVHAMRTMFPTTVVTGRVADKRQRG
jgi:ATP-dependent exoDNAse (exonuclease V) beta subunit